MIAIILITIIISNKSATPGYVYFTCKRRAHFICHHTTEIAIWTWPRVQSSKFKDHKHLVADKVMVDLIELAEEVLL